MISRSIDVLIYFEHISRELDTCFYIKNNLEKLGLTTKVLPIHKNRYYNIAKYKPKMIVVPFLFADKLDRLWVDFKKCYNDVLCLNLHHEQIYNEMTKSHFMPKNEISKNSYHLSWTERFAHDLIENKVQKEKIFIVGNPRTDNYYLTPLNKISEYKKGYNKLIFIPTSFSWAFVDEEYFINNAKLDKTIFKNQRKLTIETVAVFFENIRKIAKINADTLFVLRPHPFEDINLYKSHLISATNAPLEENIKVIRDGTIYDWLNISDLIVGWLTTVSIEASLFNKKNVVFQPVKLPDNMQVDFITKYDEIINTPEKLNQIINNLDDYNPNNLELRNYIHNTFGIADGKVTQRLARDIMIVIEKHEFNQRVHWSMFKYILKALIIDLPKNILLKLNLLHKYNNIYSGLIEDLTSSKQISSKYEIFKNRLEQ